MQATDRDRRKFVPPPPPPIRPPPPLPARAQPAAAARGMAASDQQWLEEAILRVIEKHADRALSAPLPVAAETVRVRAQRAPSRAGRWTLRLAVLVLIAGAAFFAQRRYPTKAAAAIAYTKSAAVHAWRVAVPEEHRIPVAPATQVDAPMPPPVTTPAATQAATATPAQTASQAASAATETVAAAQPAAPAQAAPVSAAPAPSTEPSAKATRSSHRRSAKSAPQERAEPKVAAAPVAPAIAPPAAAPAPAPRPGSLGDAIKIASGTSAAPPPVTERAESKSADTGLPDRPGASVVKSALTAVLPDARACMSAGDEPAHAVVVFASSGNVSAVQVSGGSAACIQKALGRAHLPPFSQATYSAGVPVRPN